MLPCTLHHVSVFLKHNKRVLLFTNQSMCNMYTWCDLYPSAICTQHLMLRLHPGQSNRFLSELFNFQNALTPGAALPIMLRSRVSALMLHLLMCFYCRYQPPFPPHNAKEITSLPMGYRPSDSRKFINASHLRTCRYIVAS